MNKRHFLKLIGSIPFVRYLKPKKAIEPIVNYQFGPNLYSGTNPKDGSMMWLKSDENRLYVYNSKDKKWFAI